MITKINATLLLILMLSFFVFGCSDEELDQELIFSDDPYSEDYEEKLYPLNATSFSKSKASEYATLYYNNPNPNFPNYTDLGGDCTNFVSQAILAGLKNSSNTTTVWNARSDYQDTWGNYTWYFNSDTDRSRPSWAGASGLYSYLTAQANDPTAPGVCVTKIQSGGTEDPPKYKLGDIIILKKDGNYQHSMILVNEGITELTSWVAYRNSTNNLPAKKRISQVSNIYTWYVFRIKGFGTNSCNPIN